MAARFFKLIFVGTGVLATVAAFAEDKKSPFEFHSYGRLGLNAGANPTQAAADGQSGPASISRHTRNPSYMSLSLNSHLESGIKTQFKVDWEPSITSGNDTHDNTFAADTGNWNGNTLRVRDALLELPLEGVKESSIWFGALDLGFEDIRILDEGSPWSMNVFGAGLNLKIGDMKSLTVVSLPDSQDRIDQLNDAGTGNKNVSINKGRKVQILERVEIMLDSNTRLSPAIMITRNPKIPATAYQTFDRTTKMVVNRSIEKDASTDFVVGATLSQWANDGSFWGNQFVSFRTNDASQGTATSAPKAADKDNSIKFATSDNFEFKDLRLGLLLGGTLEYKMFKNNQQKYKLDGDNIVADGTSTGKGNWRLSIAAQPVYYITKMLHAALDLNYAAQGKVGDGTPNVALITPIIRYAISESSVPSAQIYTSLTYGSYEAKTKNKAIDSTDKSKTLVTSQTGLEYWF